MADFLEALKKYFGNKFVAGVVLITLGIIFTWNLPKIVVLQKSYAEDKQQMYKQIERGDLTISQQTQELQLQTLLQQKWLLVQEIKSQRDEKPTFEQQERLDEIKKAIDQNYQAKCDTKTRLKKLEEK